MLVDPGLLCTYMLKKVVSLSKIVRCCRRRSAKKTAKQITNIFEVSSKVLKFFKSFNFGYSSSKLTKVEELKKI
jgi:hypothetical protein